MMFLFVIGMLVKVVMTGAPQLNTFKVAASASTVQDMDCLGGLNSTFSVSCGVQPRINAHNLASDMSAFGEFPWQVAIIDAYEQMFLCSGVLISEKTVLTAARCVSEIPVNDLRVRLGEWDILNEENLNEAFSSLEMPVSKKYLHPDVGESSERYNEFISLSLLKLRRPLDFGEFPHIKPVCLPSQQQLQNLGGLRCYVAGWSEAPLTPLLPSSTPQDTPKESSYQTSPSSIHVNEAYKSNTRVYNDANPRDQQKKACNFEGSEEACYATNAPNRHQKDTGRHPDSRVHSERRGNPDVEGTQGRSQKEDEDETMVWSRILGKAAVRVLGQKECQLEMGVKATSSMDSSSICLFAQNDSQPCLADIGAPIVCEVPRQGGGANKGWKRAKTGREEADLHYQNVVVGVVSHTYSCRSNPTISGSPPPVLAVSISRILDHLCRITGAHK